MIWGWIISSAFIVSIGLAMSDLASSMPTSGGQSADPPRSLGMRAELPFCPILHPRTLLLDPRTCPAELQRVPLVACRL